MVYVCVLVQVWACIWRSENKLQELILNFSPENSRNQKQPLGLPRPLVSMKKND